MNWIKGKEKEIRRSKFNPGVLRSSFFVFYFLKCYCFGT
jgi:hypothetical protein